MADPHLDDLRRDGFTVVAGGLPAERIATVNRAVDDFKVRYADVVDRNADDRSRLNRVVNLHLAVEPLLDLYAANPALPVCDRFFGAETVLYTSLYFERGSEQDLHRDSPVFTTRPEGRYLGVWTALEDVDADNGPLVVVPGSHALDPVDLAAMARARYGEAPAPEFDDDAWDEYQGTVQRMAADAGLEPMEVHVKAGDVIVWHPLLLHGGQQHRRADRSRRSLVMHVTPRGVPVYHQDVFFDPGREVPEVAPWGYAKRGQRAYAAFGEVDFAHEYRVPVSQLGVATAPQRSFARRVSTAVRTRLRRTSA